jgi:hypothetical protein
MKKHMLGGSFVTTAWSVLRLQLEDSDSWSLFSICFMRMCHAMMTRDPPNMIFNVISQQIYIISIGQQLVSSIGFTSLA